MNKCNSIECNSIDATNKYSNLSDQTKFRLNEINKIKNARDLSWMLHNVSFCSFL